MAKAPANDQSVNLMSATDSSKSSKENGDLLTGVAIAALGLIAAVMATGFDDQSRSYPLFLGVALLALGVLLAGRALASGQRGFPERATLKCDSY
ncbi:MAG: hypothetical protein AAF408_11295 [Pseudomonadota bacterium]